MKQYSEDSNYKRLIQSKRWTLARNKYLKEHPVCERCKDQLAVEVHHINILNNYRDNLTEMEQMCFDTENLMSVCHNCHIQLHKEAGKWSSHDTQALNREKVNNFLNDWLKDN